VEIAVVEWLRMQSVGVEIAGWQYFIILFFPTFLRGDCSIRVSRSRNLHKVGFSL